ncbi:MAG: hypothetical protein ABJC98_03240 [Bacteroidota bacterium]
MPQMKVAHRNKNNTGADDKADYDWKRSARLLEQDGDNEEAIDIYKAVLKKQPHNAYLYDRLMIIYRKEKAYKKELSVITAAIKKFSDLIQPVKKAHSKKITSLSKSILHAVGLTDKKGLVLYQPQPIARWEKRKRTANQRLAKTLQL